jgi:hypothetical protein
MRYTKLDSNDMPLIKPDTPYLIFLDGSVILQGFGVVAKFDNQDQAEEFCKTSSSFKKWDDEYHAASKRIDDNFTRFINECKNNEAFNRKQ